MAVTVGRLAAELAEKSTETVSSELIDLINRNIKPPNPVEPDQVHIRAMYIVSDRINSFGGRFPSDEHPALVRLLVDSPVLIGHRKDKLPIGRTFHATLVERDGEQWVKSYFYWLKTADGATDLQQNIDGGIYKECSIGFTFAFPECAVCGDDFRRCDHEPFGRYSLGDKETLGHFLYRRIDKVLETSLVYRGATANTAVSGDLFTTNRQGRLAMHRSDFAADKSYVLTPAYDATTVMVTFRNGLLSVQLSDGRTMPDNLLQQFSSDGLPEMKNQFALLVGYRGRTRCTAEQVHRLIDRKSSRVSRLEVKLFPDERMRSLPSVNHTRPYRVVRLRHRLVCADSLDRQARQVMTRDGVQVWEQGKYPPAYTGRHYHPIPTVTGTPPPTDNVGSYTLAAPSGGDGSTLTIQTADLTGQYQLPRFNYDKLRQGSRFVAFRTDSSGSNDMSNENAPASSGLILELHRIHGGYVIRVDGPVDGWLTLHPMRLGRRDGFMLYRPSTGVHAGCVQ
ncbi:MAG: hypothetical protein ACE5FH_09095 [Candidatus Zixiibacteriota bacterium]